MKLSFKFKKDLLKSAAGLFENKKIWVKDEIWEMKWPK